MTHHHHDHGEHDHDHGHGDEHSHARVHVFHATAPTCWWSWGFESVLNRIPLVYGEQVEVHLLLGCPYEDVEEYKKHYEVDDKAMVEWRQEALDLMGVPLAVVPPMATWAPSQMPATLAAVAALRQGEEKGTRFVRAFLRIFNVEGHMAIDDASLTAAAKEAGLDLTQFAKDRADEKDLRTWVESQGDGFPHLPLGFYNLVVSDGQGTSVVLDHAFDPAAVERAIDYVAGTPLKKERPTDVVGYLRHHGAAPTREIERVFALDPEKAQARLTTLEKEGKVRTVTLAGATHWVAT